MDKSAGIVSLLQGNVPHDGTAVCMVEGDSSNQLPNAGVQAKGLHSVGMLRAGIMLPQELSRTPGVVCRNHEKRPCSANL